MFPLSCTCLPSAIKLSRSSQSTKRLNTDDNHMDLSRCPEKGFLISASKRMASILAPCKPCLSHLRTHNHHLFPQSLSGRDLSGNASRTVYQPHSRVCLRLKRHSSAS